MVKLSWLKFMKAFLVDPTDGRVRGWNIRAIDDELDRPWRPKLRNGQPITFGHFDVVPADNWRGIFEGVVLDYSRHGRSGNGLLNGLRDPLVSLEADSTQQLLGMRNRQPGISRVHKSHNGRCHGLASVTRGHV